MRSDLWSEILQLSAEHLLLVLNAMMLAIAIGVPLGIYLTRKQAARPWLLGFSSVMQTIPSLALFGFLIPIPFIGGIGNAFPSFRILWLGSSESKRRFANPRWRWG